MHVAGLMVLDPATIPAGSRCRNPRVLRDTAPPRGAVPPPARRDPARHPPSAVDRGSGLRPRPAPPPHRGPAARRPARAVRARRRSRQDASRSLPSAVGVLDHRRARGRQRRRAHEGAPRGDRRRRRATRSRLRCCNSRPRTNRHHRPRSGSPIVCRRTSSSSRTRRRRSPVNRGGSRRRPAARSNRRCECANATAGRTSTRRPASSTRRGHRSTSRSHRTATSRSRRCRCPT